MGVRGLTTYIARRSDKYLESYQLHDTYLIIDGNNLAAHLYRWHAKCYDCFGGDYDTYYRVIVDFFAYLQKCNVTPLILFDGCYENKKLKTIYQRVKNRVTTARRLRAATEGSVQVFPLFLRELFTETVIKLGLKVFRTEFEADYEMACLARTLNCPILSYDSDFYIFDVLYIPFSTIDLPCKKKKTKERTYWVIDCKLYKIDNFLNSMGIMDKSVLPLIATLLGNDYVNKKVFKKFYRHLKLAKMKCNSEQQRRIETIIKWFQHETYDTAVKKILSRVKYVHRKNLASTITEVADGYICTESKLLPYFGIQDVEPTIQNEIKTTPIDVESIPDEVGEEETSSNESENSDMEVDDGKDEDENIEKEIDIGIAPGEKDLDKFSGCFPQWFIDEYSKGNFPAWFMDIAVRNRYFFIPQIENYENKHSHTLSLPLVAALHKMLRGTNDIPLNYIARNVNTIGNFKLDYCSLDLPDLEAIEELDAEARQKYLLKILEFDYDAYRLVAEFPRDWATFVLGIIYWVKNSEGKVTNNHIYALMLSALIRKVCDAKLGTMRTIRKVERMDLKKDKKDEDGVSKKACVNYMKEMIPYFYMDEKMYRNPKLYDIFIIDPFARFQSCLFHIKYLNKVLRCPFDDFLVSDFYNATFVYNIFVNLSRRVDSLAYLKNVFNNCSSLFDLFLKYSQTITNNLDTTLTAAKKRRKRKSRSKSTSVEVDVEVPAKVENESAGEYDENNPYTILNCA